ncbi:hypothetical protein [Actinoplanes sp. L3-i22]|uniref:hypothetical protein n=1 Tax=Actinoplanes sp. L3-i22 TaxID=2836373 RepID=UPI001C84D6BF|nr:hypothetical protein [Actinoplanes sp. L3-i22]
MMRSRIVPVALLCACLASLAACGDSNTESAAPKTSAIAAAPSASGGGTGTGGKVTGDKELCDTVNKAGSTMKNGLSQAQKADGHVEVADAKKAFTAFHATVNESLVFAEATEVTVAARAVADEVAKAATAADPISAAADAGFAQLSGNLTTACQAAGVTINF